MKTSLKARVTLRGRANVRRPLLALIPGGPGLSSATLKGLEACARWFDLAFVDPPGTGGLPPPAKPTFARVCDAIVSALAGLERPTILLGHSFGGFYALQALSDGRLQAAGLVLMSTPLSPETYAVASRQYERRKDDRLTTAERHWDARRDDASFRRWIASYGSLYFARTSAVVRGSRMLAADRTSAATCLALMGAMSDEALTSSLVAAARAFRGPKLFVAGQRDLLYPAAQLRRDAASVPIPFKIVRDAGHFPAFEQPALIAKLLRDAFA